MPEKNSRAGGKAAMAGPPDQRMIKVVIVDDHPLVREAAEMFLNRAIGIEVVGTAVNAAEGLHLVGEHRPDVLLLDISLPDISGVEVARRVRREFPAVAVVILTGYHDIEDQRALLDLDVRGYLPKTVLGLELVAAIQAVAQGRTVLVSDPAQVRLPSGQGHLTAHEHEVLRLVAAGLRNAEIASVLSVSVKTVEFHVSNILRKLEVRSRIGAMLEARRLGIVVLEAQNNTTIHL